MNRWQTLGKEKLSQFNVMNFKDLKGEHDEFNFILRHSIFSSDGQQVFNDLIKDGDHTSYDDTFHCWLPKKTFLVCADIYVHTYIWEKGSYLHIMKLTKELVESDTRSFYSTDKKHRSHL